MNATVHQLTAEDRQVVESVRLYRKACELSKRDGFTLEVYLLLDAADRAAPSPAWFDDPAHVARAKELWEQRHG